MDPKDIQKLQESLADALKRADAAEKALLETAKRADAAEGRTATLEAEAVKLREARKDAIVVEELQAQLAAVTAQVAAERKLRVDAEDPKRFATAVMERTRVESAARAILGDKFRADTDNRTLMIAVLEKTQGPIDAGKSDAYVAARFDAAVEAWTSTERILKQESRTVPASEVRADARTAREKMIADRRTLQPLSALGGAVK